MPEATLELLAMIINLLSYISYPLLFDLLNEPTNWSQNINMLRSFYCDHIFLRNTNTKINWCFFSNRIIWPAMGHRPNLQWRLVCWFVMPHFAGRSTTQLFKSISNTKEVLQVEDKITSDKLTSPGLSFEVQDAGKFFSEP